MKQKKYFILAAAAALFAACSSDDGLVAEKPQVVTQQTADDGAINFNAYVVRNVTRAGSNGAIGNTTALETLGPTGGFGVFAYHTNGEPYTGTTKPDFMYNQLVSYNSGWKYDPIKYWPNEFGDDASSAEVDYLSFFAYAPWVEVEPLTGLAKANGETNILGMTRNNATGDPFVKYLATMDATNSVDLCYGVAAEDFTSSNSKENPNNIKAGKPYMSVVKPGLDGVIKFDFKHATAQLTVTIDADVNAVHDHTNEVDLDKTRIWIRSITFEGITQSGSLNLNNHEWYDVNGTNKITSGSITVYDGRKDGREANEAVAYETPATISNTLVQESPYELTNEGKIKSDFKKGVTKTTYNLFKDAASNTDPIFVIPTGEPMKVTIIYDVETVDPNLANYLSDGKTKGSTIENRIFKTIDGFGNIEAGKHYTLNLHLGMRTVEFLATVSPWLDKAADVDLPINVPLYAAGSVHEVTVAAETPAFTFGVNGLTAGTDYTASFTSPVGITSTSYTANSAGIGVWEATIGPNNTVNKVETDNAVSINSTPVTTIKLIQLPHALGLTVPTVTNGATTVTLGYHSDLTSSPWGACATMLDGVDDGSVIVKRGSTALKYKSSDPGADEFSFNASTGVITVNASAPFTSSTVYTIIVKAGDADAETVTFSPIP